ncbi:FeoB-associated Cys-rich membrane protein [Porphyromonadaceae bacterium W3.11]|nr:FeoB-associated Cys-rich membrane protein [Porphyromonadaceae bacterium W3.11]
MDNLVQYIIVGVILLVVLFYMIRHIIRLFQQKDQGCSSCSGCSMNQDCGSSKEQK